MYQQFMSFFNKHFLLRIWNFFTSFLADVIYLKNNKHINGSSVAEMATRQTILVCTVGLVSLIYFMDFFGLMSEKVLCSMCKNGDYKRSGYVFVSLNLGDSYQNYFKLCQSLHNLTHTKFTWFWRFAKQKVSITTVPFLYWRTTVYCLPAT